MTENSTAVAMENTMQNVIPSVVVHVINTFQWKLIRNLENVSLFVKYILPAIRPTYDKVVPGFFPAVKKSRTKKTPSAVRRSVNRSKHFQETKATEQASLPKSPATEVIRVPSERNRKLSVCLQSTVVTI